jgi:hypothetical protein
MINGWRVIDDAPQPGDIVAEAHHYSDATGHMGIVVEGRKTISAASTLSGKIVQNDWGFREGHKPTFRRCTIEGVGSAAEDIAPATTGTVTGTTTATRAAGRL